MRRHERAAMLIIGAGITPILGPFVTEKLAIPAATVFTVGLVFAGVIGGARRGRSQSRVARRMPTPTTCARSGVGLG